MQPKLSITTDGPALNAVKNAHSIMRALNHPLRRKLMEVILESGNCLMVTELFVRLRIEQSVCSQHLAILRKAGAVSTNREGKYIFYSVPVEKVEKMISLCNDLIQISKS